MALIDGGVSISSRSVPVPPPSDQRTGARPGPLSPRFPLHSSHFVPRSLPVSRLTLSLIGSCCMFFHGFYVGSALRPPHFDRG